MPFPISLAIQAALTMQKSTFHLFSSKSQEILQVFEEMQIVIRRAHLQPSVLGDKQNS